MNPATTAASGSYTLLTTAYAAADGQMVVSDATAWAAATAARPMYFVVTMPGNFPLGNAPRAVFSCTGTTGNTITGMTVVEGLDQAFPVKSTVGLCGAPGVVTALRSAIVPLAGLVATTGGAVAAWVPPEGAPVVITRAVVYVATKSTGAATLDIGVATNVTTTADTLIDGCDVGTAANVAFDNITDISTNGKSRQLLTGVQAVTVTGSADTTGLVGTLWLEYLKP